MCDSNQEKAEPKEEKEMTKETKEEEKENNIIQEEEKENSNENKDDQKEKEEEKEDEKENEEEKEKSESSKESDSESKESKESKDKKEKDSEENEEDDDEDDDVDDDDNDEGNSDETDSYRKQKDPYHEYLNSKIQFTSFFSCISRNEYVYGIKQNKFYKIVDTKNLSRDKKAQIYQFELKELKPENKDKKVNIKLMKNMQYMASLYGEAKETEKDLQQKETKEINDKNENNNKDNKNNSEDLNSNKEKKEEKEIKEENKEDKSEEKKEKNEVENKEKEKDKGKDKEKNLENPYKKKNKKKQKNNNLTVVIKDLLEYTFFQKIRVIYLNSLNNAVVLYLKIDINTTIIEIINKFASLYHYKSNSRSDKLPLSIFINGKMHSISNNTKCKFFIPTKFDYKNDYILILEKQITKLNEYELSTSYNNLNLKGIVVPHVVYNSLYNFEIDSFLISKNMDFLDCQIYELKKDINIRQFTDNENTMKQK